MKREIFCEECMLGHKVNYASFYKAVFSNKKKWECEKCHNMNENLAQKEMLIYLFFLFGPLIYILSLFKTRSEFIVLSILFYPILMPLLFELNLLRNLKKMSDYLFWIGLVLYAFLTYLSQRIVTVLFIFLFSYTYSSIGQAKDIWKACTIESDCMTIIEICGEMGAVNKRYADEYYAYRNKVANNLFCAKFVQGQWDEQVRALCENKKCVLK